MQHCAIYARGTVHPRAACRPTCMEQQLQMSLIDVKFLHVYARLPRTLQLWRLRKENKQVQRLTSRTTVRRDGNACVKQNLLFTCLCRLLTNICSFQLSSAREEEAEGVATTISKPTGNKSFNILWSSANERHSLLRQRIQFG